MFSTPSSEQELIQRTTALCGKSLRQVADELSISVPADSLHAKGWVGSLLETALAADATTYAGPDFMKLGIELKTIPVLADMRPKESTFVCVVQLNPKALASWEASLVNSKLSRVLWVPYEAMPDIPLPSRRIGKAILWSPDRKQLEQLKTDWQEFSDAIVMGELDSITATMGEYLQIRPKAANASALTQNKNTPDKDALTLPRGFYLRPGFTQQILATAR